MSLSSHFKALFAFVLLLFASAANADSDLGMGTLPLFVGMADGDCYPLKILLTNRGTDAVGEVVLHGTGVTLHYPVELPRGTKKAFIAYPFSSFSGEPLEIDLETNKGSLKEKWTNPAGIFEGRQVLTITDNPGEAGFLKIRAPKSAMEIQDIYGKPNELPDRAAGYGQIYAVMLGSGAEMMSDTAIAALEAYVVSGGKLAFFGGAAPVVARDPRWQALCPVTDLQVRNLQRCTISLPNYRTSIDEAVTEAVGKLADGAIPLTSHANDVRGGIQAVYKPFGAGTVYYLGLDPFEDPFAKETERPRIVSELLNLQKGPDARAQLLLSIGQGSEPTGGGYGVSYSSSTVYGPSGPYTVSTGPGGISSYANSSDPFSVTLPSAWLVGAILIGYVLLVAPLNLLILKKVRKSEWAWVTAPFISLAFAAIFFSFAGSLYSASLSKKVNGVVIADPQSPNAYAMGQSQLFFPRGGSYDLKMSNVESATNGVASGIFRYRAMDQDLPEEGFDALDDGNIEIPGLRTSNLGFHQIDFRQRLTDTWPTAELHLDGHRLTGQIANPTKYDLEGATIYIQQKAFPLGTIRAGQTMHLDEIGHVVDTSQHSGSYPYDSSSNAEILLSRDRFLLTAQIENFDSGPEIGKAALGSSITLFENLGAYR